MKLTRQLRASTFVFALCAAATTAFAQGGGMGDGATGSRRSVEATQKKQKELNAKRPKGAKQLFVDGVDGPMTKAAERDWK